MAAAGTPERSWSRSRGSAELGRAVTPQGASSWKLKLCTEDHLSFPGSLQQKCSFDPSWHCAGVLKGQELPSLPSPLLPSCTGREDGAKDSSSTWRRYRGASCVLTSCTFPQEPFPCRELAHSAGSSRTHPHVSRAVLVLVHTGTCGMLARGEECKPPPALLLRGWNKSSPVTAGGEGSPPGWPGTELAFLISQNANGADHRLNANRAGGSEELLTEREAAGGLSKSV